MTAQYNGDQRTPTFADLLRDFMWSQRPPLNGSKLADLLGVARPTIYNWLNRGVMPQAQFLPLIALKTGIPLARLYEVTGYPMPQMVSNTHDVWSYLVTEFRNSTDLDEVTKQRVIQRIEESREVYRAERAEQRDQDPGTFVSSLT